MDLLNLKSTFELGKLYYEKTDFQLAIPILRNALETYHRQSDFNNYFKCLNLLLHIYREQKDLKKIDETKATLENTALKNSLEISPGIHYTLGLCASYRGKHEASLTQFEKSLTLALAKDRKEDICHALVGLSLAYMKLNRLEDSLNEINNLRIFFQVLNLPEIKLSSDLLHARLLCQMNKSEQAIDLLWNCLDDLKIHKDLYSYIQLLYILGVAHSQSQNQRKAHFYLSLTQKIVDPENLVDLHAAIKKALSSLSGTPNTPFDLIFEESLGLLTEKDKGEIDLKSQFILTDMLKLFLRQPGKSYSKKDLVSQVWKQDYNPKVHDNKIYVTIKRLRQIIEPNYDKPRYILRTKNGYYLNQETKIHWH